MEHPAARRGVYEAGRVECSEEWYGKMNLEWSGVEWNREDVKQIWQSTDQKGVSWQSKHTFTYGDREIEYGEMLYRRRETSINVADVNANTFLDELVGTNNSPT